MHPAYSVILFTTASGAGYGLLALLAMLGALGIVPIERWLGFVGLGAALGLVTIGLLSSTFHLGHPERSWRAFSQWRSSWLSREGVLAVAAYIPAVALAWAWIIDQSLAQAWAVAAWLSALAATLTVYCTSMIYASLRTIPQWSNVWVAPVYLALAWATGAVCLNLLLQAFGVPDDRAVWVALAGLAVGLAVKLAYWTSIDGGRKRYTAGAATGLGRFGKVRPLDPPHTQPNFVLREMGYQVARSHALRLRRLTLLLGFLVPGAATALTLIPDTGPGIVWALAAFLSVTVGVVIERWLFFAEAQHVVTVYYGADAA